MRRMRQGRRIGCTTLVVLATTGGAGFAQETAPPISLEEMATRLAELEERSPAGPCVGGDLEETGIRSLQQARCEEEPDRDVLVSRRGYGTGEHAPALQPDRVLDERMQVFSDDVSTCRPAREAVVEVVFEQGVGERSGGRQTRHAEGECEGSE